jgi:hypothetical protein
MIDEQGTGVGLTPRLPNAHLFALDGIVPELIWPRINRHRKRNFPVPKQKCKLRHVVYSFLDTALYPHVTIAGQVLGNSPHGSDGIVARIDYFAGPNTPG